MSEYLNVRAYRYAFWEMLEREQPIEIPRKTYETRCEGRHVSVTENVQQPVEKENARA